MQPPEEQHIVSLLENERAKYKTILNLASDGIFLMDLDGRLIEFSSKVLDLLGYSAEEARTLTVYDWDKEITEDDYGKLMEALHHNDLNIERTHTRKDDTTYIAQITATLFKIDEEPMIYAAVRDVTDIHNMTQQLQLMAITDELTGLRNRKSYNIKIDEALREYQRYRTPTSIILFDVDQFKNINDNYGHATGDQVLVNISNELKSIIRESDYLFRVGGEEFAAILINTPLVQAITAAEKIRSRVEASHPMQNNTPVTVSIGVTEIQDHDSISTIFNRADKYLYAAKAQGKNRVVSE